MATDPASVLPEESDARFERLCKAISALLEKHLSRPSSYAKPTHALPNDPSDNTSNHTTLILLKFDGGLAGISSP
jgi:hypothetical protein